MSKVRLIDANALIKEFLRLADDEWNQKTGATWARGFEESAEVVEDAPTIDQAKWIPCKDRLPEVGRNVLLSVGKGLYTAEGELKHDGTWVQYRWSANIEKVDAWAEMPEPWREEEDE